MVVIKLFKTNQKGDNRKIHMRNRYKNIQKRELERIHY